MKTMGGSPAVCFPACSADGAPIALQALQFAISGAAGLGLGLIYDLLRALRRRNRRLAILLDLLFCAMALLLFLLLALYPGHGILRLFMLGGIGLGIILWFLTASPGRFLQFWTNF